MPLTREQTTLFASLGLASAFALGTIFGDAVHPEPQCTSLQAPSHTADTAPKTIPQHRYWHDTVPASQPSSHTAATEPSADKSEIRWHDTSPLPDPK